MRAQFTGLDYALEIQGRYQELVQKLDALNGQVRPEEKHRIYNAAKTWATECDACQVSELAALLKKKLSIPTTLFYRDLRKAEKAALKDSKVGVGKNEIENGKAPLTAHFPGLVDIVEIDGKPAFLAIKEGALCWNETAEVEDQVHLPPPSAHLPWLLPRLDEVLKHYKQLEVDCNSWMNDLRKDLFDFLYNAAEMPSSDYYSELLVPWVFHTYLIEHFDYSPIISLCAVPERGKSRMGKALTYLSYRGAVVETLRESNIIRLATDCRASIFFDTMGFWRKVERNQSEDVVLGRYEKGGVVPRVLWPERGPFKDTRHYAIFGPTILATNEALHNILETRAVIINMPETSRAFTQNVAPELALPLKERLTAFRAYYLNKTLPEVPKPSQSRLGDILQPLYQIVRLVRGKEGDLAFLEFVSRVEEDRRMERSDTLEAQVVRTIVALESEVERGILPVKLITNTLNATRPEKKQLTPQRVGRLLNSLALNKCRTSDGSRAILWDENKILRLQGRYGVKQTSVTSETPVTSEGNAFGEQETIPF